MQPKICELKPNNLKHKLPHHIKDDMLAIAQMPLHMENYARCKIYGKTLWPPNLGW